MKRTRCYLGIIRSTRRKKRRENLDVLSIRYLLPLAFYININSRYGEIVFKTGAGLILGGWNDARCTCGMVRGKTKSNLGNSWRCARCDSMLLGFRDIIFGIDARSTPNSGGILLSS